MLKIGRNSTKTGPILPKCKNRLDHEGFGAKMRSQTKVLLILAVNEGQQRARKGVKQASQWTTEDHTNTAEKKMARKTVHYLVK